jgi:hypothetical protein
VRDIATETLDKIEAMAAAYATAAEDAKKAIALEYIALVGHFLIDQGRSDRILFPLLDVLEELEAALSSSQNHMGGEDRRQGDTDASPHMLARVSAVIDLLTAAGFSQEHAAQILTRQMLSQRLKLPLTGGDPRGWRRVHLWRQRFLATGRESPQWAMYVSFKEELLMTFGTGLAHAAVRNPIWDRRSKD